MPSFIPHVPSWQSVRSFVASCWRDPDADEALAAQFRGRQLHALVAQLPMFSLCTLLLVGAALAVFHDYVGHPMVVACSATLCLLVALIYVPLWRAWGRKSSDTPVSARTALALALAVALSGVAFSLLALYLFNLVDDQRRVLIAGVVAALISTCSWMFASLPQAALTWTLSMSATVMLGIAPCSGNVMRRWCRSCRCTRLRWSVRRC